MKKLGLLLSLVVFLMACQENEPVQSDLTGNETTYALHSGSDYPVNGTVTFKEVKDGSTRITVALSGIATFVILKVIDLTVGLRVSQEQEDIGLDLAEHDERAYSD